jgi:dimethylaniline monooxygenase (N-oxide forming)
MKKRIAIIGAGPSGLVSAKACLEHGLEPTVFEKYSVIGGVWASSAWSGMHTNLSKWSCMFSDFPWPDDMQDFPIQSEVLEYLKNYADKFDVTDRIRFNSEVSLLKKNEDGWFLGTKDGVEQFDAVIIASGFFTEGVIPAIKGQSKFQGHIFHSSEFMPSSVTADNRIVVCGGSFSAYELASEFAKVSNMPVAHVFRRPAWVLKRNFPVGQGTTVPVDFASYSRKFNQAKAGLRVEEIRQRTIDFFNKTFGNPKDIHPDLAVSDSPLEPPFVVISDDYLDLVKEGRIIPVCGASYRFNQNSMCIDSRREIAADTVVMATGFRATLPFLNNDDKAKIEFDENNQFMPAILSETVWPNEIQDMGFVGFYRGPFFAIMELQARWVAGVFSGDIEPPSKDDLMSGIEKARSIRSAMPRPQFPYGDYVDFADRLAKKVGCYPNVSPQDRIWKDVFEGPLLPSHYRLMGQGENRVLAEEILSRIPHLS